MLALFDDLLNTCIIIFEYEFHCLHDGDLCLFPLVQHLDGRVLELLLWQRTTWDIRHLEHAGNFDFGLIANDDGG